MATGKPGWLKAVIALAIVFGIIGVVAGGWMFAPLIIIGIVLLVLMPKLGGVPPTSGKK
jgi:hypothetical protein